MSIAMLSPSVEDVYQSALDDHPEFLASYTPDFLKSYIANILPVIADFEQIARNPLEVSPATAEEIGLVRIHSGVGSYDMAFKPEDNPRLREDKPWLAWFDRNRIRHGVRLVRKIAEARSGFVVEVPWEDDEKGVELAREETRQQIAEYGPSLLYSGYPVETATFKEVMSRPGIIMPKEKVIIIEGNPKNTSEGSKMMMDEREQYEHTLEGGKQAAIVSHAPHVVRALHLLGMSPYYGEDAVPYIAPLPTPDSGATQFATMETMGILNYSLLEHTATVDMHPYQLLK